MPAGPTTRRDFATAHPPQTIAQPIILDRAPIRDRDHIQFTPTMPNASLGDSAIVWDGGPTLNTVALPDRDPIHLALRPLDGGQNQINRSEFGPPTSVRLDNTR